MIARVHDPENLRRSALLRQLAELDRLEPSPQLDRAVLEQAHDAVRPAHASRVRRSLRWAAPAVLTLALVAIATSVLRPEPAVIGPAGIARRSAPARLAVERPAPSAAGQLQPPHSQRLMVRLENVSTMVRVDLPSRSLVEAPPPPPFLIETGVRSPNLLMSIVRPERNPDPREWLRSIRELRAEGRVEEADRDAAAFRRAYPGYPDLPPQLGGPGAVAVSGRERGASAGALEPLAVTGSKWPARSDRQPVK